MNLKTKTDLDICHHSLMTKLLYMVQNECWTMPFDEDGSTTIETRIPQKMEGDKVSYHPFKISVDTSLDGDQYIISTYKDAVDLKEYSVSSTVRESIADLINDLRMEKVLKKYQKVLEVL